MGVRDALAVLVVTGGAWALTRYFKLQAENPPNPLVKTQKPADPFIVNLVGDMFKLINASASNDGASAQTALSRIIQPAPVSTIKRAQSTRGVKGLLNLIASVEAPLGYNQVYGGIRAADRPKARTGKELTQLTVGQVLTWQDSIDHKYNSEASGRYQIMEDTLRGLVGQGAARTNELFNEATQDRLAIALMKRRGLAQYQRGQITSTEFGQRLSMEWASLPAFTNDKRGRRATGQSYYAGDGLNRSHLSKQRVLNAIKAV